MFNKFKTSKAEVWALILLTAAISITMSFHHALSRSAIFEEFFWTKTARYFENIIQFTVDLSETNELTKDIQFEIDTMLFDNVDHLIDLA